MCLFQYSMTPASTSYQLPPVYSIEVIVSILFLPMRISPYIPTVFYVPIELGQEKNSCIRVMGPSVV